MCIYKCRIFINKIFLLTFKLLIFPDIIIAVYLIRNNTVIHNHAKDAKHLTKLFF